MTGDDQAEFLEYARKAVGAEHGLTEAQAARLRGTTLSALRDDAAAMRSELGLEALEEPGQQRDERGRFSSGAVGEPVDMNAPIREKAGR
jgi:hypothetical protein